MHDVERYKPAGGMAVKNLTDEEHRQVHVILHNQLDILVRDMMKCTGMSVSGMTVAELLDWSSEQTRE